MGTAIIEAFTVILFRYQNSKMRLEMSQRGSCQANSWILVITPSFLVFSHWSHFAPSLQLCGSLDNQQHHSHGSWKTNKCGSTGGERKVLNTPEGLSLENYHDVTSSSLDNGKKNTLFSTFVFIWSGLELTLCKHFFFCLFYIYTSFLWIFLYKRSTYF